MIPLGGALSIKRRDVTMRAPKFRGQAWTRNIDLVSITARHHNNSSNSTNLFDPIHEVPSVPKFRTTDLLIISRGFYRAFLESQIWLDLIGG